MGPHCFLCNQVPEGQTVSLSFRVFDLELHPACRYDALEVFAGSGTSGQRLGRFCGTFRPAPIVAPGNQVTLKMTADEGTGGRGFLLWYSGRATSGTGETSLTFACPLSWPHPDTCPVPSLNLPGPHCLPFPFASLTAPPVPPPRLLSPLLLPPLPLFQAPPQAQGGNGSPTRGWNGRPGVTGTVSNCLPPSAIGLPLAGARGTPRKGDQVPPTRSPLHPARGSRLRSHHPFLVAEVFPKMFKARTSQRGLGSCAPV